MGRLTHGPTSPGRRQAEHSWVGQLIALGFFLIGSGLLTEGVGPGPKAPTRVIGRERWVEEKDIPQLPYIDAIVKETMRLHPVVVFLTPHHVIQYCKVAGYDIRKGTPVLINTWSIG